MSEETKKTEETKKDSGNFKMWSLSNRWCKYFLDLFIILVIGAIFGFISICSLMVSGKHPPQIYLTFAYILTGISIVLLSIIRILVDALETSEDLNKKIEFKKLDIELAKLNRGN